MSKEKLSISEMAKLRGISVDTLRYYDKIDLFKPSQVDEKTGYRHYSILQYEVPGTIMELRQIGLSIEEIKQCMQNRNLKKSIKHIQRALGKID
ncbi:MerR family transcriptional regulator [Paenibacillus sp. BJ-4]|uniref:MerR family transcriptional regulator n=1 Tax=Paenibacillus sp. BJ-4 TaxID=2878097 RepID=UPI001CEFEB61|nr:MerR family transcriptional regulator [Paenibacillus sp. BJ-4]